jgi:hypothetical protein
MGMFGQLWMKISFFLLHFEAELCFEIKILTTIKPAQKQYDNWKTLRFIQII